MLKELLEKSAVYKKFYEPHRQRRHDRSRQKKHELLVKEGKNLLALFAECCKQHDIAYWLEFGTLLGAYRDRDFIANDFDIDVGVNLKDARILYEALIKHGFTLVREFHVVGENGLEQTFEYRGLTIDIMYFYEYEGMLWCNGIWDVRIRKKLTDFAVTGHYFKPFGVTETCFLGLNTYIPDNVEEHLTEIYGDDFMVYNPDFPGDLNKVYWSRDEKIAVGFINY